jgi:hypothetical protein
MLMIHEYSGEPVWAVQMAGAFFFTDAAGQRSARRAGDFVLIPTSRPPSETCARAESLVRLAYRRLDPAVRPIFPPNRVIREGQEVGP